MGKVLAFHVAAPSLIPDTPYGSQLWSQTRRRKVFEIREDSADYFISLLGGAKYREQKFQERGKKV